MRIGVPDLVSNSYFPAVAAVDLGAFEAEGLDADIELVFPVTRAMEMLRDGELDYVAGSAHAVLTAFPGWDGASLLAALAQHMYWFLVLRSDLGARRGEIEAVKGPPHRRCAWPPATAWSRCSGKRASTPSATAWT